LDFKFTAEDETFRQEVRAFIDKELPPDWTGSPWVGEPEKETEESWQFAREFTHKMQAEKGWLTMHWPKEYGGHGASAVKQCILYEEIGFSRAPLVDIYGPNMVGPTLIYFGTEEQKKEHLPRIKGGQVIWTQGFSEPDAGSDLVSLKTSATEEADHFVINGQKTWSSIAHYADWMFILVRTDPHAAKKHEGLSLLYLDMKTQGITYTPLINIARGHTFNEVFFENVRVPKNNLIGEKNKGWLLAMATLNFERAFGIGRVGQINRWIKELVGYVNEKKQRGELIPAEALVREHLVQLSIDSEVLRLLAYRVIYEQSKGRIPSYEASIQFAFGAELMKRLFKTGMQILGPYSQLGMESKWAKLKGLMQRDYLYTPALTLAGGTTEIHKNIIASRGLGLPRSH